MRTEKSIYRQPPKRLHLLGSTIKKYYGQKHCMHERSCSTHTNTSREGERDRERMKFIYTDRPKRPFSSIEFYEGICVNDCTSSAIQFVHKIMIMWTMGPGNYVFEKCRYRFVGSSLFPLKIQVPLPFYENWIDDFQHFVESIFLKTEIKFVVSETPYRMIPIQLTLYSFMSCIQNSMENYSKLLSNIKILVFNGLHTHIHTKSTYRI